MNEAGRGEPSAALPVDASVTGSPRGAIEDTGSGGAAPGRARLPVSLRLLLAAAFLVPLLGLGAGAWYEHARLMAQARDDIIRLSAVAKEHALKVVETNALVLDRIEDRLRGLGWDAIRAQGAAIRDDLRALDEQIAQITSLHAVAPDGKVEVLSLVWPTPPLNLSGRAYFQRLRDGETGLVFGEPVVARLSGIVTFTMARRRRTPDGGFDGAVVGSVMPGYFQAQWHEMEPEGRTRFALMRDDGQVLAQHPRGDSDLIGPPDPDSVSPAVRGARYLPVIEHLGEHGEWLTAFRRVGEFPLLVSVAISLDRVRAEWLANVAVMAAVALSTALALAGVTALAIRRWRSERATLARLERTASDLRAEIARREAAEEGLQQAQRLESLGRLTGGIAHDFNNLLTAILGTVRLLERHLGPAADEKARRLLGVARDAVGRGARLNTSLLAFARRQALKPEPLDANDLVGGLVPLIQRALGEMATLTVALEPFLPACRADPVQIESALLNLAINARDALPRGGRVTLSTRRARVGPAEAEGIAGAAPGEFVAIALTDDGTGMTPEVRRRAFEPFFTTKPAGQGTGLGLSQVYGSVRQLGGHVTIASEPGMGTTVTLFLPVAPASEAPPAPRAAPAAAAEPRPCGATILVAEDDDRVREVTVEMLREAGFRVLSASDGAAALQTIEREAGIDLLFSDIVMPGGLDGIALARAARRIRPGLPVLLATGFAGLATDGEETAHGFEIVAKPYDQAAVIRRIAELVRREVAEVSG